MSLLTRCISYTSQQAKSQFVVTTKTCGGHVEEEIC